MSILWDLYYWLQANPAAVFGLSLISISLGIHLILRQLGMDRYDHED